MPEIKKIKVIHLITSLRVGGAETMLCKLMKHVNHDEFDMEIVCLSEVGAMGRQLVTDGVIIHELRFPRRPWSIFRLVKILLTLKPDILQTWMYHSDFIGGVLGYFCGVKNIVWGVRRSELAINMKVTTRVIARVCAWLSYIIPKKIVCCAHAAKKIHGAFGYSKNKLIVIPNGFETKKFSRCTEARAEWRAKLDLTESQTVIGSVGRWVPEKNYIELITACADIIKDYPNTVFIFAGRGMDANNKTLNLLCKKLGVLSNIRFLGQISNPSKLYSCLDVFILASLTEGFPNVVGEAMSCQLPCVVTPAGDAPLIVGDNGIVLNGFSSKILGQGLKDMLNKSVEERYKLGIAARKRIINKFSVSIVTSQYEKLYSEIVS